MTEFLQSFELTTVQWIWVAFCALCIGMAKTGLGGAGMLVVPIMASIFGARPSTGIVLLLLIMADFFGVGYYHRHAELKQLIRLIPSTISGVLIGIWVGERMSSQQFQILLAVVILLGIIVMVFNFGKQELIPKNIWVASLAGLLGGFTTMIGNAGGPVMSIYFLSMGFQKNKFIGTAAWFFLVVNVFKVPFHITIWETITWETLWFDLFLFPFIVLGAFIGVYVTRRIPERPYRIFIMASVTLAAVKLFF